MPTYNSLGISASLLVTNLDQTLSDEINLRMGKSLQEDTKRIRNQLSNGRALREQPTGPKNSEVGIFQLCGEDEDMVLLVVAVSDGQDDDGETVRDSDDIEGERPVNTDAVPTSTGDTTPPDSTPTQTTSGHKRSKRIANNQRAVKTQRTGSNGGKRGEQLTESSTTPFDHITAPAAESSNTRKLSESHRQSKHPAEELALCLKVDFTKFYEKDKVDAPLLNGKDLKLEVFINGQLMEVTYENSRPYKRTGLILYSGTRFHRQAEKPWIYVPTAAITSDDADITPDQRWDNISESLEQEANMRGTDIWGQLPISAQFLASLARSKLPKGVKTKSRHFAVVDLVVTAGKGRKFGPDTTYLTEPTHLADKKFSGLATMTYGSGPLLHQDGDVVLHNDSQMFGGVTTFQPSELTGNMFGMPSGQAPTPATPRTPRTMDMKTSQRLRDVLNTTPMKQTLTKYENSKGHVKGTRTLRQRLGDISKMSPRKQQEVLSHMREDLDEDTMNAIMVAFDADDPESAPSEPKTVGSSFGDFGAPTHDVNDTSYTQTFATTVDPLSLTAVDTAHQANDTSYTQTFATTVDPLSLTAVDTAHQANDTYYTQTFANIVDPFSLTVPETHPSLFEDDVFGSYPQFHPTTASEGNSGFLNFNSAVPPADVTPFKIPNKITPASALSGSPASTAVKYHHSHHNYNPTAELTDPFVDDQPVFGLPSLHTGSPFTPQQTSASSQKSKKALAREQLPDHAVTRFQVPDLFKKSTVSYADGLKQRQAIKARGGEFEEQQFVVGMRFIVL